MSNGGFAIGPWEIALILVIVGIGGGGYLLYLIIKALRKYTSRSK